MPQQQLLHFDEIPVTRYKISKEEEMQDNSRDYDILFSQYITSREPMTP